MSNDIIQGLWIGSALSTMEQLSIASFLGHGHQYHLYVYDEVKNVPAGTSVKDANEILPAASIFQYRDRPSYAGFSNYFRYKLLFERGGWWADSDMVCLRPFDFIDEYVFSTEIRGTDQFVNCGVIKAPPGSDAMGFAWEVCKTKDPQKIVWGETGPHLAAQAVTKFGLEAYAKPYYVFCSIIDWHKLLEPYVAAIDERAYAVHLWNEYWRSSQQDKNGAYHPACIYEQLKQRYLSSDL